MDRVKVGTQEALRFGEFNGIGPEFGIVFRLFDVNVTGCPVLPNEKEKQKPRARSTSSMQAVKKNGEPARLLIHAEPRRMSSCIHIGRLRKPMPISTSTAAQPPRPAVEGSGVFLRGRIFDLKRFSTHDGPGIRSTVFLTGCPLRCAWCHNPEAFALEESCISPTSQLREVSVDQLIREFERDVPYYDRSGGGVTISGGEPLCQADFTLALLAACRRRELHCALDTSGCANPAVFAQAVALARLVLYDIKLLDHDRHVEWTGASNTIILENLQRLESIDTEVWVRLPIVPGVNDHPGHISDVLGLLRATRFRKVSLLPFHRIGEAKYRRLGLPDRMTGVEPPSAVQIETIRTRFAEAGFDVSVGK